MISDADLVCHVCGLAQPSPPWGDDGVSPTYDYCDCCGVEFGYGDASALGIRRWRFKWLQDGAQWHVPEKRPEGWVAKKQLAQIPTDFQ